MSDFLEKEKSIEINTHGIWAEKYRPTTLDEYIGNETVRETCKLYVEKQDVPHLLLFGQAGTGKTSLAKILTRNISCDYLYINASSENRVEDVRIKMKNYASSAGFKSLKILILDEADRLTPEAQGILRNMMETYSVHTRFILTCNYYERIISPIVSRCQVFEIKPLNKKEIAIKLVDILKNEGIEFTQEDIVFIVNTYYPDIRKCINFAQQSSISKKLKICKQNAIESNFLNKLVDLLKTAKEINFNEIRQLVSNADLNSLELAYAYLYDKVNEYGKGKESLVIIELADSIYQSSLVIPASREITFLACIYKIFNHLK